MEERECPPTLVKHCARQLCQAPAGQPHSQMPVPSSGFATVALCQVVSASRNTLARRRGLGVLFSSPFNLYLETRIFTNSTRILCTGPTR